MTTCAMGRFCSLHNFVHGAEAEQLREEMELLIENRPASDKIRSSELQRILDKVDARDSVAFLEMADDGENDESPTARVVKWGSLWQHPKHGQKRVEHRLALAVGYAEMGDAGCWSIENLRAQWVWVSDPTPAEVRAAERRP